MKITLLLVLLLCLPCFAPAEVVLPTKDSEVCDGATIIRIEPDGLVLTDMAWGADIVKIPFFVLSEKSLAKYGLSEAGARAYQSKFAEARSTLPTYKSTLVGIRSAYGTPQYENKERSEGHIPLSDSKNVLLIRRPIATALTYTLPRYHIELMFDGAGSSIAVVFYPVIYSESKGAAGAVTPYQQRQFSESEVSRILKDFYPLSKWNSDDASYFYSTDGSCIAFVVESKDVSKIVIADLKKLKPRAVLMKSP